MMIWDAPNNKVRNIAGFCFRYMCIEVYIRCGAYNRPVLKGLDTMKKIIGTISAVLLVVSLFAVAASADNGKFSFGMYMSASPQDQSLKQVFSDLVNYLGAMEGVDVELKWFVDKDKFMTAAANKELDFVYTKNYGLLPDLILKDKYVPFAAASLFGKKKMRTCLFTRNDVKISGVEDMRGKSLITYGEPDGYYPLIQITGEKPEEFFGTIEQSLTGQHSLKKLIAGDVDIALAYNSNINALKMGNPSVVKKIKELYCTYEFYNTPIMSSEEVPEDLMKGLLGILKKGSKHEALKKYRPMMMATKIRFFPVTPREYQPVIDAFEKAKEEGWHKDFVKWMASYK